MPLLQQREAEVSVLAARYGEPLRRTIDLPFHVFDFKPLGKPERLGEVCMVVRRPDGRLITARKTTSPPDAFRLLTGGIDADEPIETALLRETYEETGLDVRIRQFLAVLHYRVFADAMVSEPSREFFTCAFLLDEIGGTLAPQDEKEQIAAYRLVFPHELEQIAATLETIGQRHVGRLGGRLGEWGMFRAAVHWAVFAALG